MREKPKRKVENCKGCSVNVIPKAFCCFLDGLGYTRLDFDYQMKIAQQICCVYNRLEKEKDRNIHRCSFIFRVFSDNIVVIQALEVDIDDYVFNLAENLRKFIEVIGILYKCLIEKTDLLFRGGISLGKILENDYVVGGQALVNAYTVESKLAEYPLVMIDPNIVEKLFQRELFFQILECSKLKNYLIGIDNEKRVIPLSNSHTDIEVEGVRFYVSPIPFLKEETRAKLKRKCKCSLQENSSLGEKEKEKYEMLLTVLG